MKQIFILLTLLPLFSHATFKDKFLEDLMIRRDQVKSWATLCKPEHQHPNYTNITPFVGQFSSQLTKCSQGDLMIFGGFSGFSAQFAEDFSWADARHRDQELSQGADGRWWRGPIEVDFEKQDTFSRDQASGLMMYFVVGFDKIANEKDPIRKEMLQAKYRTQMKKWLWWIENHGKGRMCREGDQRCEINGLIGSIIYRVAHRLGAIDDSNKNHKVIKRLRVMKNSFGGLLAEMETATTPPDYQMLLKIIQLVNESYLGDLKKYHLKKAAYWIYKKDPSNTLYRYLYQGIDEQIIKETLARCPAHLPSQDPLDYTTRHDTAPGEFQWKHETKFRSWEIENGHGCLYLLNLMIAELKGNLPWLYRAPKKKQLTFKCPIGLKQIGKEDMKGQMWPVCETRHPLPIARAVCLKSLQTVLKNEQCLIPEKNHWYRARPIHQECRKFETYLGDIWVNAPVCYSHSRKTITKKDCDALSPKYKGYFFKSPVDQKEYCALNQSKRFKARTIKN